MPGDTTYNPFDVTLPLEVVDLSSALGPDHREVVTDGLPVVMPTRAAVVAMLGGRRADDVVAVLPPMMGEAALGRLAALAVLAGCPPAVFPVLVAAVEAIAQEDFNLLAVQTTTGNVAVAVLISGPGAAAMGFHAGSNGIGPGPRSNVTTGRALRLVLMNVGGATPGLLDVASIGWPGKLSFCAVEHSAASPWPPFHTAHGFPDGATVVTVVATYGFVEMADAVSTTAGPLLANVAAMMAASLVSGSRGSQVLALLTPQHAHVLVSSGFDRRRTQEFLYERLFRVCTHTDAATGKVVTLPSTVDDILLFVTGGNGGKSAFVPVWSGSRRVSAAVK
jgi:hypothetical protein